MVGNSIINSSKGISILTFPSPLPFHSSPYTHTPLGKHLIKLLHFIPMQQPRYTRWSTHFLVQYLLICSLPFTRQSSSHSAYSKMVLKSWLKQVALLQLLSTSLVGVMAYPFSVIVGNHGTSFCVALSSGDYNKKACMTPPALGTCYTYNDIVKKGRSCSPDGVFCWDMWKGEDTFMVSYANKDFYMSKPQCFIDTSYALDTETGLLASTQNSQCKDLCSL